MSKNKLAVITGASAGIGKELAFQMAAKGYDLLLVARREKILQELKNEIEAKHQVSVNYELCDLSKRDEYKALAKKLEAHKIDFFFNNAGVGYFGTLAQQDAERIDEMIHLLVNSITYLTNTVTKQMAANGGGTIVNVSSIAAFSKFFPGMAVYAACKKFVYDLSRAVQFENEKLNNKVTVVALQPGAIKTEWQQNAQADKNNEFKHAEKGMEPPEFVTKVLEMIFAGKKEITFGPMARQSKMMGVLPAKAVAGVMYSTLQKNVSSKTPTEKAD